jgi:guanylate kinase
VRIFISGPSGVGKSTAIKEILEKRPDLILSVSYTTRPPRPGEQDGVDYFFISRETFEEMIRKGSFLEWANVHGQLYGTSLDWIKEREKENIIFDIDVQGVTQVKAKAGGGCFIFLVPPTLEALEHRLGGRGTEDPRQLDLRLKNARHELAYWKVYDYLVINDKLEKTIEEISLIIDAQKSARDIVLEKIPWLKAIG